MLQISYPILPPTENSIRQIRWIRKGGRPKPAGMCYTPEAEGYKRKFKEYLRQNFFVAIQKFKKGHTVNSLYVLRMFFYFPEGDILNKTWTTIRGKKRPKGPYKKMDVGNRRKLLEDCLSEAIAIDDSLFFAVEQYKFVSDEARVDLVLEEELPQMFAVPDKYLEG